MQYEDGGMFLTILLALREDVVKRNVFVEGALEMRATTATQAIEVGAYFMSIMKDIGNGSQK